MRARVPVTQEETFVNRTILRSVAFAGAAIAAGLALPVPALAQSDHVHALRVNGVPGGLPVFCAGATVVAVSDGAWSSVDHLVDRPDARGGREGRHSGGPRRVV